LPEFGFAEGHWLFEQGIELGAGGGGEAREAEVFEDVLAAAHAGEGDGDAGGAAAELEGALGVGDGSGEAAADFRGEAGGEAGLHEAGAGDDVESGGFGLEEDGVGEGFAHAEVEGELQEAEAVGGSAGAAGAFEDAFEGEGAGFAGFFAEAAPGGEAVVAELGSRGQFLAGAKARSIRSKNSGSGMWASWVSGLWR
jgi:hypothetical protein